MKKRLGVLLTAVAMVSTLIPATVLAVGEGVTINEIRIDQPSTDNDEYFELTGAASTDLSGPPLHRDRRWRRWFRRDRVDH